MSPLLPLSAICTAPAAARSRGFIAHLSGDGDTGCGLSAEGTDTNLWAAGGADGHSGAMEDAARAAQSGAAKELPRLRSAQLTVLSAFTSSDISPGLVFIKM